MSDFKWTPKRSDAAQILALGYTAKETAETVGVATRTVERWKADLDFMTEVDRLTLMSGVSLRAERLRIAMRVIRQKMSEERIKTGKDILDWLKYAQGETDGFKFDFASVLADETAMEGEQS